ncbi:IS66 family transposase [Blautia sp. NSJ-175]|uniref:IS66 family transposase n=1 Tax=Blautia sp. NSJ-175 TaxID=2931396 RepID=UPI001FD45061|nr:IS66 family transposase [Blautia sp. NSJ-175]
MANSSKDLQLRELKDMITDLKNMIKTLQATVDAANKREEVLVQERDNLKDEISLLRKKLFGSSSEKRVIDVPGQLNLFNEAELEQDPSAADAEELAATLPSEASKKRKTRATDAERFKGIPVIKKYLDIPEEDKVCPVCNTPLVKIGEEFVRRELVFVPAKLKVIEIYSLNYSCLECSKEDVPVIKKGKDGKPHMLYGIASAGTVAWVMYQKFCNSLPYCRQEKDWKQYGATITRATMANWVIRNSEAFFRPMYEYFHRKLLERNFAMADETPLQVLHEEGRRAQTKSYMWLFRSGEDGDVPIILYKYSPTRAGDNAVEFLQGFDGYLMCDGYSGYNKVSNAKRTACWAHIRRYLTDVIPKGKQLDYTQPSVQGMMYINQLFHLEDVIKTKYSSFDAIKKARLEKEKPIVEGFLSWLDKQNPVRGSRMDKAVTYIQNRRDYLMTYLEDGRCSFSNNLSENALRPFTVGRKNWLFCDTPHGAQASAIVYTMVEMAKANGVNVYHYLTYLLEKLPDDSMSDDELDQLAPWNKNVKAEIQRRTENSNQS